MMAKKILIMGLSGSGKTTLAEELKYTLELNNFSVDWFNGDEIRSQTNNWDFSLAGRMQQCIEMRDLAIRSSAEIVICDFIAPIPTLREIFEADYIIWLDTISNSEFADTDALFVPPTANYTLTTHDECHVNELVKNVKDLILS